MGGGRLDYQLTPNNRIMGKWHEGRRFDPFGAGGRDPSGGHRLLGRSQP